MAKTKNDYWGIPRRLSRYAWADRALKSRANAIDHSKKAKKIKTANTFDEYENWVTTGHSKYDLSGYDHPRDDVKKIKKMHYKYVGSPVKTMPKMAKLSEKSLKNFTTKERREIGKVIMLNEAPDRGNWLGQYQYFPSDNVSVIKISPTSIDDEGVYTHELVHARRSKTGSRIDDRNRDETETEFETIGRISKIDDIASGYYSYISNGNAKNDITHDRILLTGDVRRSRKGTRFVKDVKSKYKDSKIKDAHFSPAENLDRYFQIILPDKRVVEIHRRYKGGRRKETNASLLTSFKSEFGSNIIVYEWQNGKKVKLGGQVRKSDHIKMRVSPRKKIAPKKNIKTTKAQVIEGTPSSGPKLIKVTKGGMVSPVGEYHVSLPAVQRHRILKALITKEMRTRGKTRDEAELAVYRRLNAMRTLFKNTKPKYARIINEDMEYFKKNLTGANRKMAYPKAAVTKRKSMSHTQRVRARKKGKRRG